MNISRISASPIAHGLIALLGTRQGLTEVDLQKMFDGLSGVDQVALSVRDNRVVAMITGSVADSKLPSSEPAPNMGVKRFSLTVWIGDRVTSDVTLELNGAPNANALRAWQTQFGSTTGVEGNAIHARASMDAVEVQQKIRQIADGPLRPSLAALVEGARYLPVRDNTVPKQTKPIIYGLDGGPREVNQ